MAAPAVARFANPADGALLTDADALRHGLQRVGWANPTPLAQLEHIHPLMGFAGSGVDIRVAYAESAALALSIVPADSTIDAGIWLFAALGPPALEAAISPALGGMERQRMNWAQLLVEAHRAWRALPADKRPTLGAKDFMALPAFETGEEPEAWMLRLTWGMLRRSEAGLRTAALLELHCGGHGLPQARGKAPRKAADAPDVALLQQIYDDARAHGFIQAIDSDDRKARAVVEHAATAAAIPRTMCELAPRGDERAEQLDLELTDGRRVGAFDGTSTCARRRTRSIIKAIKATSLLKVARTRLPP